MASFKLGDKVTLRADQCWWDSRLTFGKTYEVEAFTLGLTGAGFVQLVGVSELPCPSGWDSKRFVLASEKPKRKVYIAGPMTGIPDDNFPAFNAAAAVLTAAGLDVFNPADHGSGGDWAEYMKQDIPELLKCDAVVLLDGWHNSKGASMEHMIASGLGIRIHHWEDVCDALELLNG